MNSYSIPVIFTATGRTETCEFGGEKCSAQCIVCGCNLTSGVEVEFKNSAAWLCGGCAADSIVEEAE